MADFSISGKMKVKTLKANFKEEYIVTGKQIGRAHV